MDHSQRSSIGLHKPSPEKHRASRSQNHGSMSSTSTAPLLLDAGHSVIIGLIISLSCVQAIRLARLPWAGYEDFDISLRTVGLVAGVLAAMGAAWRFSRYSPHSMLMSPSGKQAIAVRYSYIAGLSVLSALTALVISAGILLLPLLGENSLDIRFFFSSLIAGAGFVVGSTALGIVVATLTRRIQLIARVILSGGITLLFGAYSATFSFLWPLGIQRYSDMAPSPAKLWAVSLALMLAAVALVGAVFLASRAADPYTPGRALSALPFVAAGLGFAVGIATSSLPEYEQELMCDSTQRPNISVCVNTANEPALQRSIDSANQALNVVGEIVSPEQIVYTPVFGKTDSLGREIIYQPWQHRTGLGIRVIESVVSTAVCNGNEHPESVRLNSELNAHLLAVAGLEQHVGLARDSSGRIVRDSAAEGGSLYGQEDPFANTPLDVIIAGIATHSGEIASCTAQWEWFGVVSE